MWLRRPKSTFEWHLLSGLASQQKIDTAMGLDFKDNRQRTFYFQHCYIEYNEYLCSSALIVTALTPRHSSTDHLERTLGTSIFAAFANLTMGKESSLLNRWIC